jgi:hypothetical protein
MAHLAWQLNYAQDQLSLLPVDGLSVPAVVAVASWRKVVIVARRVGQVGPELLRVLHLLSDLLHQLVETRFARVLILVAVHVSRAVTVGVAAAVGAAASSAGKAVRAGELEGLNLNLLIVSAVLLVGWVGCSLCAITRLVLVVDEEIGVRVVHGRIGASLTTQFGSTATAKHSFADVLSRFLRAKQWKIKVLCSKAGEKLQFAHLEVHDCLGNFNVNRLDDHDNVERPEEAVGDFLHLRHEQVPLGVELDVLLETRFHHVDAVLLAGLFRVSHAGAAR